MEWLTGSIVLGGAVQKWNDGVDEVWIMGGEEVEVK